jgi:hypothetical protein
MMQLSIDFSKAQSARRDPTIGTDAYKVLYMLRCAGERGVTNVEFCDARLANFRSRLSELRNTSHCNIPPGVRVREGVYKYRLERTGE